MRSRNLVLLLLLSVLLTTHVFAQEEEGKGSSNWFLEFFRNTFSFIPKFAVLIDYDFGVYGRLHAQADTLVSCGASASIGACLDQQIASFNGKEDAVTLYRGFCPSEMQEFTDFFTFVHYVRSATRSSDDDCIFSIQELEGPLNLLYDKKTGTLSSENQVSSLDKERFGAAYQAPDRFSFDLDDERVFHLKDGWVLLLSAESSLIKDKRRCTFRRTLLPFCALHESSFGDIEIKFLLDLWNAAPPRMGEAQFNLQLDPEDFAAPQVPGERSVVVSWSRITDGQGSDVADLAGYRIYCSPQPFIAAEASMLSLEATDLQQTYERVITSCGSDPFVVGKSYFIAVTTFDYAGQEYKDDLFISNPVTIHDTLAPGLVPGADAASDLEQTYRIERTFVAGGDTTIVWKRPDINEEFSSLDDLAGYHIFFATQLQSASLRFVDTVYCGLRFTCVNIKSSDQLSYALDPAEIPYDTEGYAQMLILVVPYDETGNYLKEPDVWYAQYEQKLS